MDPVISAVEPHSEQVGSFVRQPLEKAFASSGCLYSPGSNPSLSDTYRSAFLDPSNKMKTGSPKWQERFDSLWNVTYADGTGLASSLVNMFTESLKTWCTIRDRVIAFHFTITSTDYNLVAGDSADLQKKILSLLADGTKLATDLREEVKAMNSTAAAFRKAVDELKAAAESLEHGWVDFAQEVSKQQNLDSTTNWFPDLNRWSDLMDLCENSRSLCLLSLDRYDILREQLSQLPVILDQLPAICFDVYGNLFAGQVVDVQASKEDLYAFSHKLLDWAKSCRTWASEDFSPRKKVRCGEVRYRADFSREFIGDDPNSVHVEREEDVQVGITLFDFDVRNNLNTWGALATRLKIDDYHNANRVWENRNDKAKLYESKLSWIEIPPKLRQNVQFSWTTLDYEGKDYRVYNPGMPEGRAQPIYTTNENKRCTWWHVKFPKGYSTDKIMIRMWIMDVFSQASDGFIGAKLEVDQITPEGFRAIVLMPGSGWLQYIRIGYVAYEEGANIDGFHMQQDVLDVPFSKMNQGQDHNFQPTYYAFPDGKFKRRPAAIAMMNQYSINAHWNYRADTRLAVSRAGFVIQGTSWSDTIIGYLRWQVLAIANE